MNRFTQYIKKAFGSRAAFLAAGILIGGVVFGGGIAVASNRDTAINVSYRDVKIVVDGVTITPKDAGGTIVEPFISDGTTYLPVRAVAAAVGKEVTWDGSTSTVYLGEVPQGAIATPSPSVDIPGGTAVDYSLSCNQTIFGPGGYWYKYISEAEARAEYNAQRQKVLDNGTTVVSFGGIPSSAAAVTAADAFFASLEGLSDYDKVMKINDFLCSHMTYSKSGTFSADDFWTGQAYGVCQQYMGVVNYMCWRADLPCFIVTGEVAGNSSPGNHGWNYVYVDGAWQYYDGTFSDTTGNLQYGTPSSKYTYTTTEGLIEWCKEVYVPGSTK